MREHVVNILPLHYDRIEEISNSIDDAIFTYNAEQKRKPYIFMDEVTYSFFARLLHFLIRQTDSKKT